MGRYRIDFPKKNVVTFKVTDHELLLLDMAAGSLFKSRSEMIRKLIFDFIFELDPEKIKDNWDRLRFTTLKKKVENK